MSKIYYQGTQFRKQLKFTTSTYDSCEQIEVVVFNELAKTVGLTFLKVEDANIPNAILIEQTDIDKKVIDLWFLEETTNQLLGTYTIEVKLSICGVKMPIIKIRSELFTIQTSKTTWTKKS